LRPSSDSGSAAAQLIDNNNRPATRYFTVVQVRAVILIAMLAIVRKLIILDIGPANTGELFGLAAAILALGAVYWLVRDQDRRVPV